LTSKKPLPQPKHSFSLQQKEIWFLRGFCINNK
jgi:hypothetical protein